MAKSASVSRKLRVLKINQDKPQAEAIKIAADVLKNGGLVAFPTETVYGLAACAANADAMERLRELKQRPDRPFTVHIGRHNQVLEYVASPPVPAWRIMRKATRSRKTPKIKPNSCASRIDVK